MDILFENVTALTLDEANPVLKHAYVGVKEGKICYVGTEKPQEPVKTVITGEKRLLMPGLVNTHTHTAMTVLRGYADDYTLQEWLFDKVFPVEARFTERTVKAAAQLAIAESLRFGVTSLTCMDPYIPVIAEACFEAGINANIGNGYLCMDPEQYCFETDKVTAQNREMLERWHRADDGRIRLDASIHAEYTSFDRVWDDAAHFARENGLNMHVHLSETEKEHCECMERYGMTPSEVLDRHGVFGTRTTAAHAVWVSDGDIDLLAERGAVVAHNPASNLKLGSGVAPVDKMRARGLRVALGTDSVCSNNNLDILNEMRLSLLLQKGLSRDPSCAPAAEAVRSATLDGAYAQGREGECGAIRVGLYADLILLNLDAPHLYPIHDPYSLLCYAASGSDVCMTMVRGKILYRDGEFLTIDRERLQRELDGFVMPHVFGAYFGA